MSDGATKRKVDVLSDLCTTEELLEALQLRMGYLVDNYKKIPIHRYRTFNFQERAGPFGGEEAFKSDVLEKFITWARNGDLNNIVEFKHIIYPETPDGYIEHNWRGTITYIAPVRE